MAKKKQQDEAQAEEAIERSAPSGRIVYKAIIKEGDEELERSSSALFFSGIAAGLSMGASFVTETLLQSFLPEAKWTPLVSKLGYSVGFLIVILGRQQLFTENTLTPILPLLRNRDRKTFVNVARLWAIVLIANLLGALAIGWALVATRMMDENSHAIMRHLGEQAMSPAFTTILLRSVFAGWLIALMVWLLPFAEVGRIWVIILITYIVGLGHFSHVVAGAVTVFSFACAGGTGWTTALGHFLLPAFLGNVVGGVMLVAVLNHAQVNADEE